MKIYVTKWALSKGEIVVWDAERLSGNSVYINSFKCAHKGEFALTEIEAIAQANQRRLKKIESLKRQITKLEKLTLKVK